MLTRRHLLSASAALGAGLALPRTAHAAAARDRRFVFVLAQGGWDPTAVFAPLFDDAMVDMDPDAQRGTAGNLVYTDSEARPSVRRFFDAWHARTTILNGVLVSSVAHPACVQLTLTGRISGYADWASVLANDRADDFSLPSVVLSGASYPGTYSGAVARTGSQAQLAGLLSGELASDRPVSVPSAAIQALESSWLGERATRAVATARAGSDAAMYGAWQAANARAEALKALDVAIDWETGGDLVAECQLAARLLGVGLSRCVSITTGDFDSHAMNHVYQQLNFEALFTGLTALMDALSGTEGTSGGTLADETVVVVLSEMGRTPRLNLDDGKDHWPYTSALLIGAGLEGDRVVGGFDDLFYGQRLDPDTCEVDASRGIDVGTATLGATLLALGDVDPAAHLPTEEPLQGLLA